jgi:hypothetical protein
MNNKNYFTKYLILVLPLLFINLNAQDQVDPLEAARLAKSAAEKAQAEADAATETAIQAAAEKAATQARENAIQAKEDEKARKLAEAQAAEEAELDAVAKAASDEARKKIALELGLDDGSSEEAAAEETESTEEVEIAEEEVEIAEEEDEIAEEEDEVEEFVVKESLGYSLNVYAGYPVYGASTLENYDLSPVIGLSVGTPFGFNLGPFFTKLGIEILNFEFPAQKTSNIIGGTAFLGGVNTGLEYNGYSISTTATTGLFANGTGFILGGNVVIPIGGLPVTIRGSARANIIQKPENVSGYTGWIGGGISIGYNL